MRTPISQYPDAATRGRRAGFSLLEMVLALVVFALVTGAALSVVRGAIRATYEMDALERENRQLHAFTELMRRTLGSLPAGASLEMDTDLDSDPPSQVIQIDDAPGALGFGPVPIAYVDTHIGLVPEAGADADGAPLYAIAFSRAELIDEENEGLSIEGPGRVLTPDDEERYWIPLVRNVRSLNWRFYRGEVGGETEWEEEEWDDREGMPAIVEMTVVQKGSSTPLRAVFKLPDPSQNR